MSSITSTEIAEIEKLQISDAWKELLKDLLTKGTKVTPENVQRIWEIATSRINTIDGLRSEILWIETGNDKAGLQHILAEHSKEFENYEPQQLMELAQASTSIGLPMGIQGKKGRSRPIFGLFFYDKPLAVAVQVGSNGFVVSMNKKSLDAVVAANSHLGSLDEVKQLLEQSHSWPKV